MTLSKLLILIVAGCVSQINLQMSENILAHQETLCSSVARTPNSICKVMSSNLVMNSDKLFVFVPHSWQHFKFQRSFYQLETGSYFSISLIIHQVKTKKITTMKELWIPGLNPLTPGTFCQKCIFGHVEIFRLEIGQISFDCVKKAFTVQHESLVFLLLHVASRFATFWLGRAQKAKFWDKKVTYVLRLFNFLNVGVTFPFSRLLCFWLQWLAFYWACLQLKELLRMCHRDGRLLPWSSHV